MAVNAGGLSEGVFESELFGHVKGAFTDAKADRVGRFELADGGTLFLDEIANMPLRPAGQAAARAADAASSSAVGSSRTRRVDVRVLAATNADLAREVAAGRFREDLLFRLNTIEIRAAAAARAARGHPAAGRALPGRSTRARYGKHLTGFDARAMQALLEHAWPGNVRELDHVVERAVLLARGRPASDAADLALRASGERALRLEEMTLEEVERLLIQGPRPLRRQRQPRGGGAGPVAQRALPPAAAARALRMPPRRHAARAGGDRSIHEASRLTHERRVLLLALLGGLPAVLVALALPLDGRPCAPRCAGRSPC